MKHIPKTRLKTQELINKIEELNSNGFTDSEISRMLNISDSNVNYLRNRAALPPNWIKRKYETEYDKVRGYMIRNVKYSANRRNLEFNLDFSDLELPEHCPLLNIKLEYANEGDSNSYNHATVDRIDNSKGYIKGNVIVVSRLANNMKNEASFDQLLLFYTNISRLIDIYKTQGALGNITDINPNIKLRTFSLDS